MHKDTASAIEAATYIHKSAEHSSAAVAAATKPDDTAPGNGVAVDHLAPQHALYQDLDVKISCQPFLSQDNVKRAVSAALLWRRFYNTVASCALPSVAD